MDIGVVSMLCNSLSVVRLVLSGEKFVGFVKYLLNELAIVLFVEWVILLKDIDWFGSLMVGNLLLRAFIVFHYVVWLCLWSQGVSICCFQSFCLCSESDWFIS